MPSIGKDGMPASNGASIVGIDSFGIFGDRLYLVNGGKNVVVGTNGGIIRSTNNVPKDYINFNEDWTDTTPSASAEW